MMIGGFGNAGQPFELIDALLDCGATDLTVVNNNAGQGDQGLALLIKEGRVRKMICSFPRQSDSWHFDAKYKAGEIELELVPQGNLAERIRAAGAGIGGFFTPTGYGTMLAEGKETRIIDGRGQVFETPIHADVALIKALKADGKGNLVYRKTARNFGPIMAAAAKHTIVQVSEIVPTGGLDPENVVTPGIYVNSIVRLPAAAAQQKRWPDMSVTETSIQTSDTPLGRDDLARLVARDIAPGSFVNLGIGQPTLVSNYLTEEQNITLHTENGMLGMGPAAEGDEIDGDLINAGKIPVTELPGASYFHHADSFAIMRGGHLDICVLGAFQVSATGDLANWHTGAPGRDSRRRRCHGPGHRRQGRLRDDDPADPRRRVQDRGVLHLPAHRRRLRHPRLHRQSRVPHRTRRRHRPRNLRLHPRRTPGTGPRPPQGRTRRRTPGPAAHPRIGNHDRRRPHGHPATAGQRPVRPVAGPRAGRDPGLRRRPARDDPQRGGGPNRPDPGHGAAVPAHPGGAGLRPDRRQDVCPHGQGPPARLRLPVRAVAAAAGPAAPGRAVPETGGVDVGRCPGRRRTSPTSPG